MSASCDWNTHYEKVSSFLLDTLQAGTLVSRCRATKWVRSMKL